MYQIFVTSQFKKDYKVCLKRNFKIQMLDQIIIDLEFSGSVPKNLQPHPLKGNYQKHWECHILPDWLLIWLPDHNIKEIRLVRTGTHSDLF